MQLDLTDEEARVLLNLVVETIENDRHPLSPRIQLLRQILGKFGPTGPVPPPRTKSPTPNSRDPRHPPARYLVQIASNGEWKTVVHLNDLQEAWDIANLPEVRVLDAARQEPLSQKDNPARPPIPEGRTPGRVPRNRSGRRPR